MVSQTFSSQLNLADIRRNVLLECFYCLLVSCNAHIPLESKISDFNLSLHQKFLTYKYPLNPASVPQSSSPQLIAPQCSPLLPPSSPSTSRTPPRSSLTSTAEEPQAAAALPVGTPTASSDESRPPPFLSNVRCSQFVIISQLYSTSF